jgi:calcium-dependent protein kinase
MRQQIGTPYYTAPEVLNMKYDKRCDVWSIGIILYILFTGLPPFNGPSNDAIHNAILKDPLEFPPSHWAGVSQDAVDLVTGLLQKNPD